MRIIFPFSMGLQDDGYYWTAGAIVCDTSKAPYILTNYHNVGFGDRQDVVQPSNHLVDKLTLAGETPRKIGTWQRSDKLDGKKMWSDNWLRTIQA